jgi:hypothetical protein
MTTHIPVYSVKPNEVDLFSGLRAYEIIATINEATQQVRNGSWNNLTEHAKKSMKRQIGAFNHDSNKLVRKAVEAFFESLYSSAR